MFLCMILIVFARTEIRCDGEQSADSECMWYTPAGTDCSTYDIIEGNGSVILDDAAASEIVINTGIWNATFNQSDAGPYIIQCADNTTSTINVEITVKDDLATVLSNQANLDSDIAGLDDSMGKNFTEQNNTNLQNTLSIQTLINGLNDVSAVQIDLMINNSRIIANVTRAAIIEVGNSAWITAVGFSTHNAAAVWTSGTRTLTSFGTLISDIWTSATRSITTLDVGNEIIATQENATSGSGINSGDLNISLTAYASIDNETRDQIITIGNADWTTGTGNDTGAVCVTVEDKS
ncbi:hypothetical protein LCGC14_2904840, partial [marine sediment metagenome]